MEDLDNRKNDLELVNNLRTLEVKPPEVVWDSIETDLNRKDRRKIVIYISYASAAVISLLFIIGTIYLSQQSMVQTVSDVKENNYLTDTSVTRTDNVVKEKHLQIAKLDFRSVQKKPDTFSNRRNTSDDTISNNIQNKVVPIPAIGYKPETRGEVLSEAIDASILYSSNKLQIAVNDDIETKPSWCAAGSIFPVYAFHTGGVAGNSSFSNESGLTSWGASFSAIRNIGKGFELEVGLAYGPFGQKINDVYFVANSTYDSQVTNYPGMQTSFGKLSIPLGASIKLMDSEGVTSLGTNTINRSSFKSVNVSQVMGYIEMPIQLVKSFKSKNLKISLKGGVSTGILVNNKLKVRGDNVQIIGKTNGVDRMLVSTMVSVGLSVPLKNSMELTIEPIIKYGLKSLPGSTSHPYSTYVKFGVIMPIFKNR